MPSLHRESPSRPRAAGRAAARGLVADYEHDHGPLPATSRQRTREFLLETSPIDDEPQRAAGQCPAIVYDTAGAAAHPLLSGILSVAAVVDGGYLAAQIARIHGKIPDLSAISCKTARNCITVGSYLELRRDEPSAAP